MKAMINRKGVAGLFAFLLATLVLFTALAQPAVASEPTGSDQVTLGKNTAQFDGQVSDLTALKKSDDFGQKIIDWIAYGHPDGEDALPKDQGSLLGHVAFTLSAISLVVMAALAALGGINYTIHTANKGAPGGQIISSFWMPIRISVATILLVPVAGGVGYSTIHLGVIKIAEMGSAHGGYLAGKALDYIANYGIYSPMQPPGGDEVVPALIASEICRSYVNTAENRNDSNGVYVQKDGRVIAYNKKPSGKLFIGWMEQLSYCGSLGFTKDTHLFETKELSITSLHPTTAAVKGYVLPAIQGNQNADGIGNQLANYVEKSIRPKAIAIANKIASDAPLLEALQKSGGDANDKAFAKKFDETNAALAGVRGEIVALINTYDAYTKSVLVAEARKIAGDNSGWVKDIKEAGWPAFGMIFWHTSMLQQKINSRLAEFEPAVKEPTPSHYQEDDRYKLLMARFVEATHELEGTYGSQIPDLKALASAGGVNWFERISQGAAHFFGQAILPTSTDANPITRLQSTGHRMLYVGEGLIYGTMVAKALMHGKQEAIIFAADKATDAGSGVPFIGGLLKAGAGALGAVVVGLATATAQGFGQIMTYLLILVTPLIIAGFTLAIVLPAIPAMYWLLGIVSYMMFFAQCLLVSTFWLAAHGTAEGQGWGSQHTRQGYLLMLGLYLNPILRVAGFCAMLLVIMPVGVLMQWMFNYIFGVAVTGITMTPIMWVGSIVLVAIFAYSAFIRIFALPSELFEQGLRWINGGQEVTGDSSSENHTRMLIGGFAHQSAGALKGVAGTAGSRYNEALAGGPGGKTPGDTTGGTTPGSTTPTGGGGKT